MCLYLKKYDTVWQICTWTRPSTHPAVRRFMKNKNCSLTLLSPLCRHQNVAIRCTVERNILKLVRPKQLWLATVKNTITFRIRAVANCTSCLSDSMQFIHVAKNRGRWLMHNFSSNLKSKKLLFQISICRLLHSFLGAHGYSHIVKSSTQKKIGMWTACF